MSSYEFIDLPNGMVRVREEDSSLHTVRTLSGETCRVFAPFAGSATPPCGSAAHRRGRPPGDCWRPSGELLLLLPWPKHPSSTISIGLSFSLSASFPGTGQVSLYLHWPPPFSSINLVFER